MNKPLLNKVYIGDCLRIMKEFDSECVDVAFADPPYNLQKGYSHYKDDKADKEYLKWCNQWLGEMTRLIKKTGSLYVLNLPKWAVHHAVFLDKKLYRRNWITWDALSTPLGKLMPAHYSLLYYTKDENNFIFNKQKTNNTYCSCYREKCIASRRNIKEEPLSDVWFDIHRIRHRKRRDAHPCQLPLKLLERIILTSSNPDGIIFDPFMGVGTTALVAKLLHRNYTGCEIDSKYQRIIDEKLKHYKEFAGDLNSDLSEENSLIKV